MYIFFLQEMKQNLRIVPLGLMVSCMDTDTVVNGIARLSSFIVEEEICMAQWIIGEA